MHRKILIVLCLLLGPVSISATLGYALYVRSEAYRRSLCETLSAELGMRVTANRVRPLSLDGKVMEGVRVFLSEGGNEVFHCRRAGWSEAGSIGQHVLELADGWLLVGSGAWTKAEYQRMLAGGLDHDFANLGVGAVRLRGIDLRFVQPPLEFRASSSSGVILFDEAGVGEASLSCRRLNGVSVDDPINAAARFTPGEKFRIHRLRLSVPPIPVRALGFNGFLDQPLTQGQFEGVITYRDRDAGQTVDIAGAMTGAELGEFTSRVPGGPLHGTVDVTVDDAQLLDRALVRLQGRGELSDLRVSEIMPRLAGPTRSGHLTATIDQLRWTAGRIEHLSARASCGDLSLDAISTLFPQGSVTGTAELDIRSVLIIDDRLRYAEIEVNARPPADGPGFIDRAALAQAGRLWLDVDLSAALPEQIEYTRLGVRLIIDTGELRVLGTHGPDGRTILTIKLLGREWPIIRQPDRTFDVPDVVGFVRAESDDVDSARVRTWWQWLQDELHKNGEEPGR